MFCNWSTMGLWGGLAMTLGWLLLIGLLVWLVASLARGTPPDGPSALAILEGRFARGELDPDEYQEHRSALEEAL